MKPTALAELSAQLVVNPYPVYHTFRKLDPVHWSSVWDAWFVTSHEAVSFVMKDARFSVAQVSDFSTRMPEPYDMSRIERTLGSWILFMDPPAHTRLRALISKAFTPRTLERMEEVVRKRVDMLLEPLSGRVNILEKLASPLPVMTIADILGARGNEDRFQRWSHNLATFLGDERLTLQTVSAADEAIQGLEGYFAELVEERKADPQDDLVSTMLAAREAGQRLEDREVVDMCTLLFAAGHDTTTNLIANGILALLQHPSERARLPEKAAAAVEEVLRWDTPAQVASRHIRADVEVGGKLMRQGQVVNVAMAAANRDPAVFPDPDRFVLDRPEITKHIAFGKGIHTCVGAHLARLEARLAYSSVFTRWPEMRLAGSVERYPTVAFRRLKELVVELNPR